MKQDEVGSYQARLSEGEIEWLKKARKRAFRRVESWIDQFQADNEGKLPDQQQVDLKVNEVVSQIKKAHETRQLSLVSASLSGVDSQSSEDVQTPPQLNDSSLQSHDRPNFANQSSSNPQKIENHPLSVSSMEQRSDDFAVTKEVAKSVLPLINKLKQNLIEISVGNYSLNVVDEQSALRSNLSSLGARKTNDSEVIEALDADHQRQYLQSGLSISDGRQSATETDQSDLLQQPGYRSIERYRSLPLPYRLLNALAIEVRNVGAYEELTADELQAKLASSDISKQDVAGVWLRTPGSKEGGVKTRYTVGDLGIGVGGERTTESGLNLDYVDWAKSVLEGRFGVELAYFGQGANRETSRALYFKQSEFVELGVNAPIYISGLIVGEEDSIPALFYDNKDVVIVLSAHSHGASPSDNDIYEWGSSDVDRKKANTWIYAAFLSAVIERDNRIIIDSKYTPPIVIGRVATNARQEDLEKPAQNLLDPYALILNGFERPELKEAFERLKDRDY